MVKQAPEIPPPAPAQRNAEPVQAREADIPSDDGSPEDDLTIERADLPAPQPERE